MRKLFRSLIAVGGLVGLVACGDDVSITGPGLAISGAPVTAIQVGATVQLSANQAVTWSSSAASVATVDANGLVTAVGPGTASITATSTANTNDKASVTITVTAPAVRSVVVSPQNAIMKPGDEQAFVANVDADPGVARTVTWASSNNAVATVTAAGVVTAVAPGAATITATSTASTSVSGAAAITVRAPIPATISVSNITQAFVAGSPTVNVNNIVGSIDVNLNVDPGEQIVNSVDVLLDGVVACSQNLSGAQSEALRIAAAFDELEAVIVSCQINTAAFDAATGVASYFNGPRVLSARANLAGGSQVATPSTSLVFNNTSGVIATITNDNGSDPASAINTTTGLQWISGDVDLTLIGVSYVSGTTVASVTCSVFGKNARLIALTNGTATVSYDEDTWGTTDLDLGGYLTANAATGETVVCPSAVLSNGQPMPVPSGSTLLNFGPFPGQQVNAAMPELQVIRYDGVEPGEDSENGVLQNPLINVVGIIQPAVAPFTAPWVNATSTLTPSATGSSLNVLGLPSLSVVWNASTPGVDVEEGVDNITIGIWVPAAGGALPTTGSACNVTGLTSVTVGSDLAETTVSSAYPVRFVVSDALGNQACFDLGDFGGETAIGADFTAPTATITGPVANTGYNALPPNWAVAASDNASGFTLDPAGALRVKLQRLNPNGTTSCEIGSGSSCTAVARPLTFDALDGSGLEGYYTVTITLRDQAGNSVTLITSQLYGYDVTAPTFAGGISLPAVIAGAATNTFTTTVGDNLDLGSIFGVVAYPGVGTNIEYQTQAIGTFGPPLEQTASVGYAAANWIRCLNPAGSFAVAANQPSQITLNLTDQTTVPSSNTTPLASGAFGANAQACTGPGTEGAAGNVAINTFVQNAPVLSATDPLVVNVDLDGVTVAATSSTTAALQAVADVPLNTAADPFARVDFFYVNPAGNLVKIGTASVQLAQTQTNRTYTYNFTWDPAAPVQTGAVTVVAIGVDAQGDAVFATNGFAINIVP
jgi:hypothetical protein